MSSGVAHTTPEIADAWIRTMTADDGSPEETDNAWAYDTVFDMTHDDPEQGWLMILEILRRDHGVAVLEVLSAGPLEDLLANHGSSFIDRVEIEARHNPVFAKLLGGVWKNQMTDEVWARVQAVWDRRGWEGIPE
jgi:Family of unknown function (DUF6869)